MKSTVYAEFMSDWIQPWLHFIPVSQLYTEIYNIHAYFSGPSKSMLSASNATKGVYQSAGFATRKLDGDAELKKIAAAGRDWMFTVGRKIDMESESCLPLHAKQSQSTYTGYASSGDASRPTTGMQRRIWGDLSRLWGRLDWFPCG